jgi:hypothetical protein
MFAARLGIRFAAAFVLLWIWPALSAELEIKKFLPAIAAVKESPSILTPAKRGSISHQPIRLALQDEVRIPACSGTICMGLVLGVGY